jgi:hypothetical protein
MSRALGELPAPVPHEQLRARMAALHGTEDALLEDVRFPKLLRQANDAEVADVRMLDETHFEVSPHRTDMALMSRPAPTAAPNGESAADGTTPVLTPATRPAAALRFRGGTQRGGARPGGVVPMVGVVAIPGATSAPTAPVAAAPVADAPAAKPVKGAKPANATKPVKEAKPAKARKPVKESKPTKAPAPKAAKAEPKAAKAPVKKTAEKKPAAKKAAKKK